MRRRGPLFAVGIVLASALALPAGALANVRVVAPGAKSEVEPCTAATPCQYIWAIENSGRGDTVEFESGEYTWEAKGKPLSKYVLVSEGVTLEPAPGDATRPIVEQKTAYASCNCSMLFPEPKVVIRELELDQAAVPGVGPGPVQIGPGDTIERSILLGADDALLDNEAGATTELSDDLLVAEAGAAVDVTQGATVDLDNVTAIAHGSHGGVALLAEPGGKATALLATNTIARGVNQDVEADAETGAGTATITLDYSDARSADELVLGAGAKITDSDHPTRGEPLFVSAATGDYEEAAGSPTIDAGTADAASGTLDLEGLPRVAGAATDIGAFEFQPPAATSKPEGTVTQTSSPTPSTGQTAGKGAPIPTAPSDSSLALRPSRFRAAAKGATISGHANTGTTIGYVDTQSAVSTLTVLEPLPGVRSGHACVAAPAHRVKGRHYRACTRMRALGSFTHRDVAGLNQMHFSGRLHGHALAPHAYVLAVRPSDSAGKGASATASFTIL